MESCIFCDIAEQKEKAHIIWEDEKHLAFLSIYPNTEGFTVVITKQHFSSYAFDLPEKVFIDLMLASKEVAKKLDQSFKDVGRTGMIIEGFGVDHVHTKLIPMHGTADMQKWKSINSRNTTFFKKYEGYLSSHDCERADDSALERIAIQIRKNNSIT